MVALHASAKRVASIGVGSLLLKLILTPALIGVASLAGRRWGPAISGWLVGLPFTSGPIAFFLVLGHGTHFASLAATGTMAGTISQAGFCLVYAAVARRRAWPAAFLAGCAAFGVATVAFSRLTLPAATIFPLVIVALVLAIWLLPRVPADTVTPVPLPAWDIPARMVVATVFVVLLTGIAPALGARLTGLLAPFPLYASVLTVFAYALQGPLAGIAVLRGLLLGLFAFASFFLVLALLLVPLGIAPSFATALAVALGMQGISLWVLHATREPVRP